MATTHGVRCAHCQQLFRDDDALRQHGLRAHFQTRQEHEEQRADAVMAEAMDRQQDAQGRREQAGQPGGNGSDDPAESDAGP